MQNHPETKHPLESYFTLIEENFISVIYSEFHDFDTFYSSFDPTIFNNASMVKNGDNYELRNGEKLIRVYTFDHHLQDFLNGWNKIFINEVRNSILDKSEKEVADYTKLLQKEILQLIIRAEKKNTIAKTQIIKGLKILNDFLASYSKSTIFPLENTNSSQVKIRWLGKVNQLVTLFHDLSQGTNNLKRVFIENNRQELKQFIFENFIDSDGQQFNEETVYRILDPNKSDTKKSKDRFIIPDNLTDI